MSDWVKKKLGDIAKEVRDTYEPNQSESIPYVGLEHIAQQDLKLIGTGKSSDTQSTKRNFRSGDILFGSLRPYFRKVVRPKFDGVCSTDITVIRSKNGVDQGFLNYLIASKDFIDYSDKISSGSRMPRANWKVLEESEWSIPNKETQQRIASILSAYDDLIENNTRRIAILEEMARLIYREWFIYYRYPGYESNRMVESGTDLGFIPYDWKPYEAQEVISFNPRTNIDKQKARTYLPMGKISENSMVIDSSNLESRKGISGAKFKNFDTLFARITPSLENGKTGFVQFLQDGEIATGSTEFIVLRSKKLNPYYIYCLARDDLFRKTAINSMVGASGRQRVRINSIKQFLIALPPSEILDNFESIVAPIFSQINILSKQNISLITTRDMLIPKLIKGVVNANS